MAWTDRVTEGSRGNGREGERGGVEPNTDSLVDSHASSMDRIVSSAVVERSPVYYGWIDLSVSTLGMAAILPGQTAGVSLFTDAFVEEFGVFVGFVCLRGLG